MWGGSSSRGTGEPCLGDTSELSLRVYGGFAGEHQASAARSGAETSLGTVSYVPSIVTMAVSVAILEIFSMKEWPDFETWVWGRSRSLKMARFDRPCYMTFY